MARDDDATKDDTHFFCYDDPYLAELDLDLRQDGDGQEVGFDGDELKVARSFRAVYEEDACTTEEVFAVLKLQHMEVR